MASENWSGKFTMHYDGVDLENMRYAEGELYQPMEELIKIVATARAKKVNTNLVFEKLETDMENYAKVIFTTPDQIGRDLAGREAA